MTHETPSRSTFGIGTLSDRTGCNIETIRYYERSGLLPPPPRTAGGQRMYGETHVRRLQFILRARALEFAIADIRSLTQLADGTSAPCGDAVTITRAHLDRVRQSLAGLEQVEQALSAMVAECNGSGQPDCAIMAALSNGAKSAQ